MKRFEIDRLEPRRLLSFGQLPAALTGEGYTSIDAIAARGDGSYVAAGLFRSTAFGDRDEVSLSSGDTDIWVAGFDPSGELLWRFTFGGDERNLESDSGRADFASLPERAGDPIAFGVSANPWGMGEMVSDITFDQSGNIYLAGIFRGAIEIDQGDLDTTIRSDGNDFYDSFVMKLSSSGRARSVFSIGGPFNDIVHDIEIDRENCIYVAGSFERRADFQPGKAKIIKEPIGRGDGFVARYTPRGRLNRFAQFGGDASKAELLDAVNDIALKPDRSVAATGSFAYRTDFDPGPGVELRNPGRSTNAFTLLLTSNWKLDWVQTQGDQKLFEGNRAVALGRNGDVYTVGYFSDEVDLTPDGVAGTKLFRAQDDNAESDDPGKFTDLFLNRFDGDDGEWKLIKQIRGTGYELVADFDVDPEGNFVLTGSVAGIADFDPSPRNALMTTPESDNEDANQGERDYAYSGFVARYSPNLVYQNSVQIFGHNEGDVFLLGASLSETGKMIAGGRFTTSFQVANQTNRISAPEVDGENEDGWVSEIEI